MLKRHIRENADRWTKTELSLKIQVERLSERRSFTSDHYTKLSIASDFKTHIISIIRYLVSFQFLIQPCFRHAKSSNKAKGFSVIRKKNFIDFVIVYITQASAADDEIVGLQNSGLVDNQGCERLGEQNASHYQVTEKSVNENFREKLLTSLLLSKMESKMQF